MHMLVHYNIIGSGIIIVNCLSIQLTNYLGGEEPSPAPPCFIEERGEHELDGHIHPDVDVRPLQQYYTA